MADAHKVRGDRKLGKGVVERDGKVRLLAEQIGCGKRYKESHAQWQEKEWP